MIYFLQKSIESAARLPAHLSPSAERITTHLAERNASGRITVELNHLVSMTIVARFSLQTNGRDRYRQPAP
jgi:hypothetical protein